ncbi:MAG: TIGR01777 family oxidoreductase [Candidatus Sericytochromatia bacterium]|nr:TIGR01777 family oxidoreductase [Candidatus Sericytochromatia bacterium]
MTHYRRASRMPVPAARLYAWHAAPGAFQRLAPPWEDIRDVRRVGGLEAGAETRFVVRKGPLSLPWVARHDAHEEGRMFADVQDQGPFASWRHVHRFEPAGDQESLLVDEVDYSAPLGPLGDLVGGPFLAAMVARMFAFRHARTLADLTRHARHAAAGPRRVLVSGSSGLIGRALVAFLQGGGHDVVRLVRRAPGAGEVQWDPARGVLDPASLEGFDAVVHLAGEGIAEGRWTPARKDAILRSRTEGTRLLAETLARVARKPEVLVSASAIGFYGDRGDQALDESAAPGTGFLADVTRAWEAAAQPASDAGIRLVCLRTGIVLSPQGGALAQMLPPFQLGLGGPVGSGRQVMSWIALDDLVGAIHHAIFTPSLRGPVNGTAPAPVTSAEFGRTLGKVLGRPAVMPLPGVAVQALFGEMGAALLLGGARVMPNALLASGFTFLCPTLEDALRYELGLLEPTADAGAVAA